MRGSRLSGEASFGGKASVSSRAKLAPGAISGCLLFFFVPLAGIPGMFGLGPLEVIVGISLLFLFVRLFQRSNLMIEKFNARILFLATPYFTLNILSMYYTGQPNVLPLLLLAAVFVWCILDLYQFSWRLPVLLEILGAAIMCVFAIGHYFGVIPVFEFEKTSNVSVFGVRTEGYTGLISSRGSYGIWLIASLYACATLALRSSSLLPRLLISSFVIVLLFCAYISLSRSTYAAVFVFMLIGIFFVVANARVRFGSTVANVLVPVSIIGTAIFFLLAATGTLSDMYNYFVSMRAKSVDIRLDSARRVIEDMSATNFFGSGEFWSTHAIHNAYLAVTFERGFVAGFFFCLVNAYMAFAFLSKAVDPNEDQRLQFQLALAGLIAVQVEMIYFHGYMSITYWAFMGFLLVTTNRKRFHFTDK